MKGPVTPEDYEPFQVEAEGIEPSSESRLLFDPTCVVRDLLRHLDSHGRDSRCRSWKDLVTSGPGTLSDQSAL